MNTFLCDDCSKRSFCMKAQHNQWEIVFCEWYAPERHDGDIGPLRDANDHGDIGMPDFDFVGEHPRADFPFGELGRWLFGACVAGVILGIILKVVLQ